MKNNVNYTYKPQQEKDHHKQTQIVNYDIINIINQCYLDLLIPHDWLWG